MKHDFASTIMSNNDMVKKSFLVEVNDFYTRIYHHCILHALTVLLIFNTLTVSANEYIPDRRKDQFQKTPAHLIVPLPYSYPGIGQGIFWLGNFSNLLDTTTDFFATAVTGDAGGYVLQLDEAPIIDERLFVKLYYQDIDRAVVNQYDKRGMNDTSKNDYTLLDVSLAQEKTATVDLTFFERRLNFFFKHTESKFEVQAIRDNNGNLIMALEEPYKAQESNQIYGFSVDLTDDYLDPKKGFRFMLSYQDWPAEREQDPSYYVLDYNILLYIPAFETDTFVLNYYQSDAHVTKKGNTNAADIRQELNINCAPTDTECLQSEQELIGDFINHRTNGTAASLGGNNRLRSYPQGRFKGGHSGFFGTEYRWNFKQEVAPFNYLFWKDVRTELQLAFFAEVGSVSETAGELWHDTRYSYGTGLRLVAASGAVYRGDIAYGEEGHEIIVYFYYPWE